MVEWLHRLNVHEFEWTLGVGDGQGGLACCDSGVAKSQTWLSNWTELNWTEYAIVYMYHSFLIHSSAKGHLGCFNVLAIENSAVMNIGVHVPLSILVSLVCMPSSGIAGSYGSSISSFFKEYSTLFSTMAASVYIPTNSAWGFYLEPVIESEVSQKERDN